MRMTAFLISLNVAGMGKTGECLKSICVNVTGFVVLLLFCSGLFLKPDHVIDPFSLQHCDDWFLQQFLQDD